MRIIMKEMAAMGLPMRLMGAWACGPCPRCGGVDRFRVVHEEEREYYTCRQCSARGDAIQFLREFRGLSFAEAKATVEREGAGRGADPTDALLDSERWGLTAQSLMRTARRNLEACESAQRSLLATRGITVETARRFGLGYLPEPSIVRFAEAALKAAE